jgi:hypothetical protein
MKLALTGHNQTRLMTLNGHRVLAQENKQAADLRLNKVEQEMRLVVLTELALQGVHKDKLLWFIKLDGRWLRKPVLMVDVTMDGPQPGQIAVFFTDKAAPFGHHIVRLCNVYPKKPKAAIYDKKGI